MNPLREHEPCAVIRKKTFEIQSSIISHTFHRGVTSPEDINGQADEWGLTSQRDERDTLSRPWLHYPGKNANFRPVFQIRIRIGLDPDSNPDLDPDPGGQK